MCVHQFSSYALIADAVSFPGCLILWIARAGRNLFPHTEIVLSQSCFCWLLTDYLSHARSRPTSSTFSREKPAHQQIVFIMQLKPPSFQCFVRFLCQVRTAAVGCSSVRPLVRRHPSWMETAAVIKQGACRSECVVQPLCCLLLVVLTANHIAACCHSIVTCDVLNWPRLLNEISLSACS